MSLLLRNVRLVDTSTDEVCSLRIDGKRIVERSRGELPVGESNCPDLAGIMVMPAAIDAHVHFRQPGYEAAEDWHTASRAALAGGVTTVFDMPNNKPVTDSRETVTAKAAIARGHGIDFAFLVAATTDNVTTLPDLVPPAIAVKLFCSETTGVRMDPDPRFWQAVVNCQRPVAVHAEDGRRLDRGDERTIEVVLSCLETLLPAALAAQARVIVCHVTSLAEIELIEQYRQQGLEVFIEVTPHHLTLCQEDELGPWGKVNPPLRTRKDTSDLVAALAAGRVDLVATDHAPHPAAAKEGPHPPSGMPGVGTLLPTLLTLAAQGRISYHTIPQVTCAGPARAYGLPPRGALVPGSTADLALIDAHRTWQLSPGDVRCGKSGWSNGCRQPYTGRVIATIRGEDWLFHDDSFPAKIERGEWLRVS